MVKQKYVLGFAFWRNNVLLMHKRKGPIYVVNKLNGIGGKIESEEDVYNAMSREFSEETGLETWPSNWHLRLTMSGRSDDGNKYELNVLNNYLTEYTDFSSIKNPENAGEDLYWTPLDKLDKEGHYHDIKIVENLSWIIPLIEDRTTPYLRIKEID